MQQSLLVYSLVIAFAIVVVITVVLYTTSIPYSTTTTSTAPVSTQGVVNVTGTSSITTTVASISSAVTTTSQSTATTTLPRSNGTMGEWQAASSYPLPVYNETCVGWSGYVYCIGGMTSPQFMTNKVYFAPVSSGGIGTWKETAPYVYNISDPSCALNGNTVYCAGGMGYLQVAGDNATYLPYVYYANLTPDGITAWKFAVPYPYPVAGASCAMLSGKLYCVGGFNSTARSSEVNYASVGNGTYQFWLNTVSYPVQTSFTSCVGENNTAYCTAGTGSQNSYYASVVQSYGGLGNWTYSGTYPVQAFDPSCSVSGGVDYCVGGYSGSYAPISKVYYSKLSPTGFSDWKPGPLYPSPGLYQGSCAVSGAYIYCIGGRNQFGGTYFAQLA